MNGRTRTLLAIAMSTALIAPLAFAQKVKTEIKVTGNATSQAATQLPRPTLPTQAAQPAVDAVDDVTRQRPMPKVPATTTRPAETRPVDAVDARVVPATTPTPMRKESPPTSQGAANAAAHSSVVQREVWTRLDADADGRISGTEADADTGFDADFAAMDSDNDGFVSDVEYRAFAKPEVSQGATNAAAHSSVVQRDTWSRLDTDGDGRISAIEADADAGIDAGFSAMDGDGDGFVTDAEFRAHAKATRTP